MVHGKVTYRSAFCGFNYNFKCHVSASFWVLGGKENALKAELDKIAAYYSHNKVKSPQIPYKQLVIRIFL